MKFPDKSEQFFIQGPVGQLQCAVDVPRGGITSDMTFVMCHPHPLQEGTMHNKVVTSACKAMNELGLPAIRFNYRGVEQSEGEYGDVLGEAEDCQAILNWLKENRPGPIVLGGFSFGSHVAFLCKDDVDVKHLLTIAPAVTSWDMSRITPPEMPWCCVIGSEDEVIDADKVFDFALNMDADVNLIKMHQTSHFFHKKLIDLRRYLKQHYTGVFS